MAFPKTDDIANIERDRGARLTPAVFSLSAYRERGKMPAWTQPRQRHPDKE
jgi:hypothetical protein